MTTKQLIAEILYSATTSQLLAGIMYSVAANPLLAGIVYNVTTNRLLAGVLYSATTNQLISRILYGTTFKPAASKSYVQCYHFDHCKFSAHSKDLILTYHLNAVPKGESKKHYTGRK